MNNSEADTLRCPTCGATQVPSACCRRCKCDLSLVMALRHQARALHDDCLRCWRDGRARHALRSALRRHALAPDATSRRLLAVAYLHLNRFQEAVQVSDGS